VPVDPHPFSFATGGDTLASSSLLRKGWSAAAGEKQALPLLKQILAVVLIAAKPQIRVAGRPHGLPDVDLRPPSLAAEIDALGDRLYTQLNNGVYRAGFATTQGAYDAAVQGVFSALDELEARLRGGGGGGKGGEGGRGGPFLLGPRLTEADVRLFPTAVRFDAAYNTLFKCSKKRLADYPYLMEWMRLMHSLPGVSDTIDIEDCRRSYFEQLFPLNPGGIVPIGASKQDLGLVDFDERTNSIDFGAIFYAHSNNQI